MLNLDLDTMSDGIVALFLGNSSAIESQKANLSSYESQNKSQNSSPDVQYLFGEISDIQNISNQLYEVLSLVPKLIEKKNYKHNLIFIKKDGGKFRFLMQRQNPENKFNWIEFSEQFNQNHQLSEPEKNQYWRVGQTVLADGEFFCRDCGYIENFKKGQVFCPCEVCMSGDPDGATDIKEGVWEML